MAGSVGIQIDYVGVRNFLDNSSEEEMREPNIFEVQIKLTPLWVIKIFPSTARRIAIALDAAVAFGIWLQVSGRSNTMIEGGMTEEKAAEFYFHKADQIK